MKKPVLIEGQEVTLATITVGDLETVDLSAKTGRKFNIAMIAASILAAGDQERGTEAWVRTVHAFDPEGGDAPFQLLLEAANEVNGFKKLVAEKNAPVPAAPAAG
jgi:hypothetical protein